MIGDRIRDQWTTRKDDEHFEASKYLLARDLVGDPLMFTFVENYGNNERDIAFEFSKRTYLRVFPPLLHRGGFIGHYLKYIVFAT